MDDVKDMMVSSAKMNFRVSFPSKIIHLKGYPLLRNPHHQQEPPPPAWWFKPMSNQSEFLSACEMYALTCGEQ